MKVLLSSLDSHLGQKGKTFLSGDKVINHHHDMMTLLLLIKIIIINYDTKVGMPDLMLWPWMERLGCLDVKHPGMKVILLDKD